MEAVLFHGTLNFSKSHNTLRVAYDHGDILTPGEVRRGTCRGGLKSGFEMNAINKTEASTGAEEKTRGAKAAVKAEVVIAENDRGTAARTEAASTIEGAYECSLWTEDQRMLFKGRVKWMLPRRHSRGNHESLYCAYSGRKSGDIAARNGSGGESKQYRCQNK